MTFREIYRATGMPVLQNRVFDTPEEAAQSATGDVLIAEDKATGLVANIAFDPALLSYDGSYQNEQAHSRVFQAHLEGMLGIVRRCFSGGTILEVGCGKGYFLSIMRAEGLSVRGIDPAYEGSDPDVIVAPFTEKSDIRADAIVLRHVLEHIKDPVAFLKGIAAANGGRGQIYIEVPCFDWICDNEAWFDLFYEHVNYFRLSDFNRIFGTVRESGRSFGGQYLYVVADLSTLRPPSGQGSVSSYPDFSGAMREAFEKRSPNRRAAIWGASSKGVIFAVQAARGGVDFDFAVDINPVKQGKFLPVTGLRVLGPSEAIARLSDGDDMYIMNSLYADEIKAASGNRFNYITVEKNVV